MIYANDRIRTFEDLAKAAGNRRAVIIPGTCWSKPKPASVILHLQGATIMRLLARGIYLYKPKTKEE